MCPEAESSGQRDETVLLLAPTARDAALCRGILAEADIECAVCRDVAEVCAGMDAGAGLALVAEEALDGEGLELLALAVGRQPAWSDFPMLILTEEGIDPELVSRAGTLGNVTLIERPVRVPALVSAVQSALRARRRHYEIRGYLAESARVAESLRDADRRKDEFLAMLAHELRNPLAPLRNAIEAVRRSPSDRNLLDWARGVMERQLAQMVRLIDDLLDLSRVSHGAIELKQAPAEVGALVRGALESCSPALAEAGHELELHLPREPLWLRCDATRIVQVLCNLLSNAVRYTPRGGRIEIRARRREDELELRVRDSGPGIPPEMLERVFDMFTRLETAQGGLGVGLTLAKRLVELHGGTIEARSEGSGRGAEFIVRLPGVEPGAAAPVAAPAQERPCTRLQRILVADDNRDAAESLARLLRLAGHDVRIAYDGQQAVDLAEVFRPAVALLDLGMPRLSGYDAARRIRERPFGRGVMLVALTGWGQPQDKRRSEDAGFDHHLVKPVDPAVLDRLLSPPA
jgi:signal transduction histidine kinase